MRKLKQYNLTLVIFFVYCLLPGSSLYSQAPQGINYQAVARDISGAILQTQNISIRFTISNGSGGTTLYQETQNATTNQFGLFTLNVGNGTPVIGNFTSIAWATVTPWLQVEMDPAGGIAYVNMGTSQLLSVPYSLFAASGNPGPQGATGPPGIQGPQGNTGLTGAPGPQGQDGDDGDRYTTTSSTSLSISTGVKNITVEDSLSYAIGQTVIIANTAINLMTGTITSYDYLTGAMVVNVISITGSGTFTSWDISLNGAPGPAGPQGITGATGAIGPAGTDGATWFTGSGVPSGATGIINDLYLNTANGDYYKKTGASTWTLQANLTGPQGIQGTTGVTGATGATGPQGIPGLTGPQGIQGATGATGSAGTNGTNGTNGALWYTGSGIPNGATGVVNDFYLNTVNGDYYKKTGASTWTLQANLTGPQGPSGSLPNGSAAGNTTYWNGTTWVVNNSNIYNDGGNVGVNTTTPAGKLHVKGSADASQLIIDANASQSNTNPLLKLRSSNSTDLLWIHSDNPFNTFIGLNSGSVNNATGGGLYNTFIGRDAGNNNTTGYSNTANGSLALKLNTSGLGNTAHGTGALQNNTVGSYNTAIGGSALSENTTASENTAVGIRALYLQSFNNGNSQWISANTAVGFNALFSNQPISTSEGISNTAVGHSALYSNTAGSFNMATGYKALYSNLLGAYNTANGCEALFSNTDGFFNTAMGYQALFSNTGGVGGVASYNTAIGSFTLKYNTTGNYNTAIGKDALYYNTTASQNTAIGNGALSMQSYDPGSTWVSANTAVGYQALLYNDPISISSGVQNTAVGHSALRTNTVGYSNTAVGYEALKTNSSGIENTAQGGGALLSNTSSWNTANGFKALQNNTTGFDNTAIGWQTLFNNINGHDNTAIGEGSYNDLTSSSYNVIIGSNAHISGSNSIVLGYGSFTNTDNLALLGNTSTIYCGGYTNWSNFSDGRFKTSVQENVKGLDFILRLRPVTYHMNVKGLNDFLGISPYGKKDSQMTSEMKTQIDDGIAKKESIVMSGFIAQEAEKAAQEAGYDFDGVVKPTNDKDHYRIAYGEFVVPLVKAVQELNEKIQNSETGFQKLEEENIQLKKQLADVLLRVEALEKK